MELATSAEFVLYYVFSRYRFDLAKHTTLSWNTRTNISKPFNETFVKQLDRTSRTHIKSKSRWNFSERNKLVALCGFTGLHLIFIVINFWVSWSFTIFDFFEFNFTIASTRIIMDFVWFRPDLLHQRRARAETTSFPKVLTLRLYLEQSKVDAYLYCKIML